MYLIFIHLVLLPGDGNCLPHALSLSMWGVDDSTLFLRRLLHVSLVTDIGSHYRTRWRTERERENCAIPGTNLNMSEKVCTLRLQPCKGLSSLSCCILNQLSHQMGTIALFQKINLILYYLFKIILLTIKTWSWYNIISFVTI